MCSYLVLYLFPPSPPFLPYILLPPFLPPIPPPPVLTLLQMEQLVVEGEGLASSIALLNVSAQMERKITQRDAQTFIKALVKDKWLSEVVSGTVSGLFHISITAVSTWQSQGVYGAGPRFILELRPFLSEVFGEEVVHCHVCKEPVIRVSDLHSNTLYIRLTTLSAHMPRVSGVAVATVRSNCICTALQSLQEQGQLFP